LRSSSRTCSIKRASSSSFRRSRSSSSIRNRCYRSPCSSN
jgi:hypothetical protein